MKKLLFLLIIPCVSFGQIKYKDIMQINSQETFDNLMFDKQFSATDIGNDEYATQYFALNPKTKDGEIVSTHFASWTPSQNRFYFTIMRIGTSRNLYTGAVTWEGVMANNYDTILKKVKRKCKFVQMYKVDNDNYACYTCKKAEFEGYLGFAVIEGKGAITNLKYLD